MLFVRHNPQRTGEYGFTIVEIAMVVAITGILAAFSLIGFSRASRYYQLKKKANLFAGQIDRARSEAIKLNLTLTMGFSSSNKVFGLTCTSCADALADLPAIPVPGNFSLSAYPTITIKGNGTLASSASTITANDGNGGTVTISLYPSGRTIVGSVTQQ